ncbi:hypothetical protein K523DRAFT_326278 [Schizophyllum commune Tattone D]|nr:hypothetical protein K523DRAFT_326278 [Schizophyllum commune Tattone D]
MPILWQEKLKPIYDEARSRANAMDYAVAQEGLFVFGYPGEVPELGQRLNRRPGHQ